MASSSSVSNDQAGASLDSAEVLLSEIQALQERYGKLLPGEVTTPKPEDVTRKRSTDDSDEDYLGLSPHEWSSRRHHTDVPTHVSGEGSSRKVKFDLGQHVTMRRRRGDAGYSPDRRRQHQPEVASTPKHFPIGGTNTVHRHEDSRTESSDTLKKPLMLPEKFDGSSSWEDYRVHFESVADINRWSREDKACFLRASLKGDALEVLTEMTPRGSMGFTSLVDALERRFGHEHQSPLFRAQLTMRTRQRGESVQQLAQAIRKLVNGAYPFLESKARDDIALEHFRNALDDMELQRAVFMSKPQSLTQAVSIAAEMESFQRAQLHHTRRGSNIRHVKEEDDRETAPALDVSNLLKLLNEMKESLTEIQKWKRTMEGRGDRSDTSHRGQRRGNPWKCWNCGEVGHFRDQCTKPKRDTSAQQGNGPESGQ
ncbi:Retroviral-like aspartic protease 1 [Holothuria leucospilota]|uniref:Retroviral-like aspartic protease 1 n=1 Tax=Holothuria leucospilota TaxID=206669 RepID=A0A9Q0YDQ0_HOLLE|nr:Retroviral-like aspartic protease 1 [Holothuria leucospilota]